MTGLAQALLDLQSLTERLRRECPWDREQTEKTIVPHTVEEAYEVADAAMGGDDAKLLDELGDLLFQVFFLSLLLQERDAGDLEAVTRNVHEKLVRRHPHVFGDVQADTAARVRSNWERIKREDEGREGIFHDVPESLPALLYARKMQQRAKSVGFEYPDVDGALADLDDEVRELKEDMDPSELGDVLFAAVNVARKLDVDPELELRRAAQRFRDRVTTAEAIAAQRGENWSELPLERQDHYFDIAKESTA
ncbi:MAG: nucleoside triphosphate pyrophosphohydrolase [Actinobacteria bacterium]|nr:nucleoside triphosphate pyrophosphohydrolase [Actinomycetota bacterium]